MQVRRKDESSIQETTLRLIMYMWFWDGAATFRVMTCGLTDGQRR